MESNRLWSRLAQETGETDLTFTQSGCLYLAESEASLEKFEKWYDLAKQHQLDTELLTKADVAQRCPEVAGQWLGGMITKTDGRGEPFVAVAALARAARRAGAVVTENCAVRALDRAGGRVAGVVTEAGHLACDKVLLAGGAWSSAFAANEGHALAQLAVRSTAARTRPAPDVVTTNISTPGLSLRRRDDGGYTVATGDLAEHFLSPASFRHLPKYLKLLRASARDVRLLPAAPKHYPGSWGMARRWSPELKSPFERMRVVNPKPSQTVVNNIRARLPIRVPALKDVDLAEAWAGMIDVTPDAVPMLGELPDPSGFYVATGLSGHGFGIGPAIGRLMADLMTDGTVGHDLMRFRPERFSDGTPIVPGPY
ncbi:MAG: NAD(P)/FAD-dependent oxidoreductase, partial [Hyphomicrobiaceae bacterium]